MKNYIYSDEEYFSEEDEEEEELETSIKKQSKGKKQKKNIVKNKKDIFDEDIFDAKVAKSIMKSHRKKDKFSEWVNENLFHLENIYKLSDISCKKVDFYFYIYKNTYKEYN